MATRFGTRLRRGLSVLFVLFCLVWLAEGARAGSLNVALGVTGAYPGPELIIDHQIACSDGAAPGNVELHWVPTQPAGLGAALASLSPAVPIPVVRTVASPVGSTTLLDTTLVQRICQALPQVAGAAPGSQGTVIRGLVTATGTCDGQGQLLRPCDGSGEGLYEVEVTIFCGEDTQNLHGPVTGSKGPPENDLRLELTQLDGELGGTVSAVFSLDDCNRHALEVSGGIQTSSLDVDGVTEGALRNPATGELGLFPAAAGIPGGRAELDVTTLEVAYLHLLRPRSRRLVPELSAGIGYAFVDVDQGDPRGGQGDDSLTLQAGLRLRINLDRYGGRYLYLGARSRWFEARDDDEIETQGVLGLGFGLPSYRRGR